MTIYLENEIEIPFDFPLQETAEAVVFKVLETEKCPYEVTVNILLTDDAGIRQFNFDFRQIDKPTDVLSFPNINYESPADFSHIKEREADCFDLGNGELVLGDIMISADRLREQAAAYGHSEKREFAFLTAHSMLHLLGYDHGTEAEAAAMEEKQENVLRKLGITRK